MKLTKNKIASFQKFIWDFYAMHGRSFTWRNIYSPYAILVSEIMLQQTQTYRVAPKFELWMMEFPDFATLSQAPLRDVLSIWQGLGYNRRALALHKIAQKVINEFDGALPQDPEILATLPNIGPNTAGSICAFAFNMPTIFIETNIRAVFIHHFFQHKDKVLDKDLLPLVQQTIDNFNPREWYYALMDYGVFLKQQIINPSRKSAHHITQSKFEGSHRQIRGTILKLLSKYPSLERETFFSYIQRDAQSIEKALSQLANEGFIKNNEGKFSII
jgi:A/G-specific adenine glycosylase